MALMWHNSYDTIKCSWLILVVSVVLIYFACCSKISLTSVALCSLKWDEGLSDLVVTAFTQNWNNIYVHVWLYKSCSTNKMAIARLLGWAKSWGWLKPCWWCHGAVWLWHCMCIEVAQITGNLTVCSTSLSQADNKENKICIIDPEGGIKQLLVIPLTKT